MSFRFTVVERRLRGADFRWKWLCFLRNGAILGVLLCLAVLAWDSAVLNGWNTTRTKALTVLAVLGACGILGWIVIAFVVFLRSADRQWLAAALERHDPRLLDRLHTLLFLEEKGGGRRAEAFAVRIARQIHHLLAHRRTSSPFSARAALSWLAVFAVLLCGTLILNQMYSPWRRLLVAKQIGKAQNFQSQRQLELATPATNNAEATLPWGEIRITAPGADRTVTKVDVVPLQIEAAASRPLTNAAWVSAVNGAEEISHPLPPPAEPRFAVFQPSIYLDEMHLSDWDVVSYYARASTDRKNSFASQIYFLEVRPFREDLLKMPGGQSGQAYETLSELSSLIGHQQQVIRQTHQHAQQPPQSENLRMQDRKKLAAAEGDLSDSAQHLYAKLAGGMEDKPIGDTLESLAKAQQSLDRASGSLQGQDLAEGQGLEREALAGLVAARKMFQKAVSDHPGDFDSRPENEPPSPVADSTQKLNQMAEFRNEARAAQDFARKALERQKAIEQQARATAHSEYPQLGAQEQQLQKALEEFQAQHPKAFAGSEGQSLEARQALAQATEQMQMQSASGRAAAQQATQALEKLHDALLQKSTEQQLADAYKLKQLLDQQFRTFDKGARTNGVISADVLQKISREARETVSQLKKTAEQEPTRDAFGPALRDALSGKNKVDLDARLLQLQQAQDDASQRRQAAAARDALGNVRQAFDQSLPNSLQNAQAADSLKPAEQDSFGQGVAELDSLVKQLQKETQLAAADQAKQAQQALSDLQQGLRGRNANNTQSDQLLMQLQQAMQQTPLDAGELDKLLEQLQRLTSETSVTLVKKDEPGLINIDPGRLPPAYRGRIQKYFEKLSEPSKAMQPE